MDDPVVLRMLERIIGVLIAGLAVFLGYRLFFHLPFQNDGKGKIELPGVKVVLARVGPGIFFAAFGSLILYNSLTNSVSVNRSSDSAQTGSDTTSRAEISDFVGASARGGAVSPQQRNKALNSIAMLNCAQRLLESDPRSTEVAERLALAMTDAKRSLLLSVWDEGDWGSPAQLGLAGPGADAPLALQSLFSSSYGGCPQ